MDIRDKNRNSPKRIKVDPVPKIPKTSLLILSICMLAHTVALTSLFPYLGFMIVELGVEEHKNKTGFYAGYISSSFMLGRMISSYFWGIVSDRKGRKPVLMSSLIGVASFSLGFGLADTYATAILMRFLLGAINAIVMVAKTMISEICAKEHQATGMGVITGTWSFGFVLGPALGGLLYDPVKQYPHVFSEDSWFSRFPYLLPNLVPAGLALIAAICVMFALPEPKPKRTEEYELVATSDEETHGLDGGDIVIDHIQSKRSVQDTSTQEGRTLFQKCQTFCFCPKGLGDIVYRKVAFLCVIIFGLFSVISIMLDDVFPLWALSSVEKGGLALESNDIGKIFASACVFLVIFQFFVYPRISKVVGVVALFRWSAFASVPLYLLLPTLSVVVSPLESGNLACSLSALVLLLIKCGNLICFSSLSLMINDSVPAELRGRINGFSMGIGSFAKALGPVIGSVAFAWSLHSGLGFPFNYFFTFLLLSLICLTMAIVSKCALPNIITADERDANIFLESEQSPK